MVEFLLFIFLISLFCSFLDSHLGGGYGTILSPLFLTLGFPPLMIIHSILISEVFTGFESGILYHTFKKVDWKTSSVLGITAGVGSLIGTLIGVTISKLFITVYIAILIIVLGILMALKIKARKHNQKRSAGLGVLIGFNKSLTGGGFGPVAVGGLSLSGMEAKKSVGTTLLAEGITCVISLLLYSFFGLQIYLEFLIPLILGAVIGGFVGSRRTKKVKRIDKYTKVVGIFLFSLGIFMLIKGLIL